MERAERQRRDEAVGVVRLPVQVLPEKKHLPQGTEVECFPEEGRQGFTLGVNLSERRTP